MAVARWRATGACRPLAQALCLGSARPPAGPVAPSWASPLAARPSSLSAIHRGLRRSERAQHGEGLSDAGTASRNGRTQRALEGAASPRQQQKLRKKLGRKAADDGDETSGRQTRRKRFIDPDSSFGKRSLVYQLKHGHLKGVMETLEPPGALDHAGRHALSPRGTMAPVRRRDDDDAGPPEFARRHAFSPKRTMAPVRRRDDDDAGPPEFARRHVFSAKKTMAPVRRRDDDDAGPPEFARRHAFSPKRTMAPVRRRDDDDAGPPEFARRHAFSAKRTMAPVRRRDDDDDAGPPEFARRHAFSAKRTMAPVRRRDDDDDAAPPDFARRRVDDDDAGPSDFARRHAPSPRGTMPPVRRRDDDDDDASQTESPWSRALSPRGMMPMTIRYTTAASQFLYGKSVVKAALEQGRRKLYRLYIYDGEMQRESRDKAAMAALAEMRGVPVKTVPTGEQRLMDKMSMGRPHNGFVLEASPLPRRPVRSLGRLEESPGRLGFHVELDRQSREEEAVNGSETFVARASDAAPKPLVLLLCEILDPGNLGALLRTASYLGVDAVGVTSRQSSALTAVALKAAAGAAEEVTVFSVDEPVRFLQESRAAGWTTYAAVAPPERKLARLHGAKFISTEAVERARPLQDGPCVLVLGNEGHGLARPIKVAANYEVSVPRFARASGVDSLNVSVAAGLLCHAFVRPGAGAGAGAGQAGAERGVTEAVGTERLAETAGTERTEAAAGDEPLF